MGDEGLPAPPAPRRKGRRVDGGGGTGGANLAEQAVNCRPPLSPARAPFIDQLLGGMGIYVHQHHQHAGNLQNLLQDHLNPEVPKAHQASESEPRWPPLRPISSPRKALADSALIVSANCGSRVADGPLCLISSKATPATAWRWAAPEPPALAAGLAHTSSPACT